MTIGLGVKSSLYLFYFDLTLIILHILVFVIFHDFIYRLLGYNHFREHRPISVCHQINFGLVQQQRFGDFKRLSHIFEKVRGTQ